MKSTKYFLLSLIFISLPINANEVFTDMFNSVFVKNKTIEFVSEGGNSWLVIYGGMPARKLNNSEKFELKEGDKVVFMEKHSSFQVEAKVNASQKGINIIHAVDGRSFGGKETKESYFMKAASH